MVRGVTLYLWLRVVSPACICRLDVHVLQYAEISYIIFGNVNFYLPNKNVNFYLPNKSAPPPRRFQTNMFLNFQYFSAIIIKLVLGVNISSVDKLQVISGCKVYKRTKFKANYNMKANQTLH